MIREDELIHIGRIVRTHGTSGELQCRMTSTLWEDNDAEFIILSIEQIFVPFRVNEWRTKGSEDVLLRLQGVDDEQRALRLVGMEAYMLRRDVPEDAETPIEMQSLRGYTMHDKAHGVIGVIKDIDTTTLNTLVQLDNGLLLPLHEDFVECIDVQSKVLTVTLPEGLLEGEK